MSEQNLLLKSNRCEVFECDDHGSNVWKKLQTFYEQQELFDIVLIAGMDNVKVQAHRIVISSSSDYFRSTIKAAKCEKLIIEDITGETLKLILKFMYTASIELRSETVETVLKAADLFQMKTLITICCDFMYGELDPCNCVGIALLADQVNCIQLYKTAMRFAYRHLEEICTENMFLQLNEDQMIRFLECDEITKASKENVFHSLISWLEHNKVNRTRSIRNLVSRIRYNVLDAKFIIEISRFANDDIEREKFILSLLNLQISPDNQTSISRSTKLYFTSGYSINDIHVQTYDSKLNKWSHEVWPSTANRFGYRLNFVNENVIVAVGGEYYNKAISSVEYLDLVTKTWTYGPSMKSNRLSPEVTMLNGELYVVGGSCNNQFVSNVEKYNFSTKEWQLLAPLSKNFNSVKVAALDGLLYAFETNRGLLECYNPDTNKWSQKAGKVGKSNQSGIAAVDGYLYASGDDSTKVERFDPLKNTWTYVKSTNATLENVLCAALNNRLIVCGKDLIREYDPKRNTWTNLAPLLRHYQRNYNLFSSENT